MVSPFMSFATGALQAVDKNIDRYRAEKAAEKEREDAAAQRMKELEFQRETRLEAGRISADATKEAARIRAGASDTKNFITIGDLKIPKMKGAEGVTSTITYLAQNPEAYAAAKKDATLAPLLEAQLARAVMGAKSMSEFYERVSPVSKRAPRMGQLSVLFRPALRNNPLLLRDIQALEDMGVDIPQAPSGAAAQIKSGGEVKYVPDGEWVSPVIETLDRTTLGGLKGANMPEKVASATRRLGNRNYDKGQGAYQGNNKFWSAASSPFVKFISTTGQASEEETKAAMDWINNPMHGFVDEQGRKTEDYFLLVDTYANKSAGTTNQGFGTTPSTVTEILARDSTAKKERESVVEALPLAQAAKRNLMRLQDKVKETGTGSRFTTSLLAGITGGEALVRDSINIVANALARPPVEGRVGNYDSAVRARFEKVTKELDAAKRGNNKEALAAAEIKMLETALAYQLTSILQGGTGGRTISDTDVTRALDLFGGNLLSLPQKQGKLKFIMGMVDKTIERGKLFSLAKETDNAEYYRTIKKLDNSARFTNYNLDNLEQTANDLNTQFPNQTGGGPISQTISKIAGLNPDYKEEVYRNEITNLLGNAEPLVSGGRYVVNKNDATKWANAVKSGNPQTIERIAKELNEGGGNRAFDGKSGKVIPIKYFVGPDGDAEIQPMGETEQSVETPAADSALAAKGRKPSGESRTGATTEDAILKLFEVRQQPKRNRPPGR